MSEQNEANIRILTGADMWPGRINHRWPGAQFIARARFDAGDARRPTGFASLDTPATWGIAIRIPAHETSGTIVTATTDRGETIRALFDAGELLAGDPEDVVAAARYWELPWRYVGALKDAAAAQGVEIVDEEPRDDAIIEPAG